MSDLSQTRCLIVLFVMQGCSHCVEYKPRFQRLVDGFRSYDAPFDWHKPGQAIRPGAIPVIIYDAASQDPELQAFANQHNVSAMPCTLVLSRSFATIKMDGAISDAELYQLLVAATQANR
jgi:hypothetical protein